MISTREIAALMKSVADVVREHVGTAVRTLAQRIEALEQQVARIPGGAKGEPGEPGRDGADGAPGKDGESVTLDQVLPELQDELREALARIPAPKDGRDGADGKSVTLDDVRPLLESMQASWALDFERRAQDVLHRAIDRMPAPKDGADGIDGKDGRDGFGFDDLQFEYDGERTVAFVFARGEEVKRFERKLPIPIYRGAFKDGQSYERGDTTTFGGSLWIAHADTSEKPGEGSTIWQLGTKRGRDGKDGADGARGPEGKAGRPGRDLTQLTADGVKY